MRPYRHCGLDPQSRWEAVGRHKTKQPLSPLPWRGGNQKERVTQPLTLGSEGEQDNTNHHLVTWAADYGRPCD